MAGRSPALPRRGRKGHEHRVAAGHVTLKLLLMVIYYYGDGFYIYGHVFTMRCGPGQDHYHWTGARVIYVLVNWSTLLLKVLVNR